MQLIGAMYNKSLKTMALVNIVLVLNGFTKIHSFPNRNHIHKKLHSVYIITDYTTLTYRQAH